MKERILVAAALLCILLGLPLLFFATRFLYEGENYDLYNLKIEGTVERITEKKDVTIINVKPLSTIPVVVFGKGVKLKKGDSIAASGRLKEYNGNLEFIAQDLSIKKNVSKEQVNKKEISKKKINKEKASEEKISKEEVSGEKSIEERIIGKNIIGENSENVS